LSRKILSLFPASLFYAACLHAQLAAPAPPVITSPANNAVITQNNIAFTGTSDPDVSVTVFVDNIAIASNTADDSGNWSASTNATFTNGKHIITAIAVDASADSSTVSSPINITVNLRVPILPIVSLNSSNVNSAFAKLGDLVTLYFTTNDEVYVPRATVAGHPVPVNAVGTKDYTATYIMTQNDAEGLIPFMITFTDFNGNPATPVTATTDNTSVRYDTTRPLVTVTTDAVSPVTKSYQAVITFNEAIGEMDTTKIRCINGTISNITHRSNNVITLVVTPTYDGDVTLDVMENAANDAAGNPSMASNKLVIYAAFNGLLQKVYPNPSSGLVHIQFMGTVNDRATVRLVNIQGVTVYQREIALDAKILSVDLSSVASGSYILFIKSKDYSFYTNLILVH
jgi:hypothetical protein